MYVSLWFMFSFILIARLNIFDDSVLFVICLQVIGAVVDSLHLDIEL